MYTFSVTDILINLFNYYYLLLIVMTRFM